MAYSFRAHQVWGLVVAGALILLLLKCSIQSSETTHDHAVDTGPAPPSPAVLPGGPLDAQVPDSPPIQRAPLDSAPVNHALRGRVRTQSGQAVLGGTITWNAKAATQEQADSQDLVAISANGEIAIPSGWNVHPGMQPEEFLLFGDNWLPTRIHALEWPDPTIVDLIVDDPQAIRILVTDLNNSPISGATLLPLESISSPCRTAKTDGNGIFSGRIGSSLDDLPVRVSALGYGTLTLSVPLAVSQPFQVRMGRIFGAGLYLNNWSTLTVGTGVAGDSFNAARRSDYAFFIDDLRRRRPNVALDYDLVAYCFLETTFLLQPQAIEITFINRYDQTEQRLHHLPLRPIKELDSVPFVPQTPDFAIPCYPLDIQLDPAQAFIGDVEPETFRLDFIPLDSEAGLSHWLASCRRIGPNQYRFQLPKGQYEVQPQTLGDESTAEAPRVISGARVQVDNGGVEQLTLTLAKDEAFVTYSCVDPAGNPLAIGVQLAPADGQERRFVPFSDMQVQTRFIRPGLYDVWYMDYADRKAKRLVSSISWPATVDANGIWRIPLDWPTIMVLKQGPIPSKHH